MYCPRCGSDCREGYTKCTDCDTALVAGLPKSLTKESAIPANIAAFSEDSMPEDWMEVQEVSLGTSEAVFHANGFAGYYVPESLDEGNSKPSMHQKMNSRSKDEVVGIIQQLLSTGKVKDCSHIRLERTICDIWFPRCEKNLAGRELAHEMTENPAARWPLDSFSCPAHCPAHRPVAPLTRIFISHSKDDSPFVEELIELIEVIGLPPERIFCSSFEGYGIDLGKDFLQVIRDELRGATLVLFLLTRSFYSSPICLCEMGAAWVVGREHIPILVPPFDFSEVRGVIPLTQGFKLNEPLKLTLFKQKLESLFHLQPKLAEPTWEKKRDNIIARIDAKLSGISEKRKRGTSSPPAVDSSGFTVQDYRIYRAVVGTPMGIPEDQAVEAVSRKNGVSVEEVREAMDKVRRILYSNNWFGTPESEIRHASDWGGETQ